LIVANSAGEFTADGGTTGGTPRSPESLRTEWLRQLISGNRGAAELPPTSRREVDTTPSHTPVQPQPQQLSIAQQQPQSSQELGDAPQSPSPSTPATHSLRPHLTPEAIAALEAEERRIDAEMEEVRRMKELRDQKYAIQQKLRKAKGT
jgi:hypothetical protein